MTSILPAEDPNTLDTAARCLDEGGLVALPTETVYGLAARADLSDAVARIFAAKGRPQFNPLIAHVANLDMAREEAVFSPLAERLAAAFWPGPLTLVLTAAPRARTCLLARAGLETVAIRCPKHTFAQDLIGALRCPVVAPSANRSGRISPTTAAHVAEDLAPRIDLIVDGGRCMAGVESTILSVREDVVSLLRPGALSVEEIEATLAERLVRPGLDPDAPSAPGQSLRHYAPRAHLRLNVQTPEPGEALLGFGAMPCDLNLSVAGDLTEAASNLFDYLRRLDATNAAIAVAPIPTHDLGLAINDRLRRAAEASARQ